MSAESNESIPGLLARQRDFFARGETRSVPMRSEALERLETALRERQEEMLRALAIDLGKPEIEAFLSEYHFLLEEIRLVRRHLNRWLRPRRAGNPFYFQPCRSHVIREPFGTTLVMAPWNYPVQLALGPVIAAVAAGNTAVLKPSELAPASERFVAKLVADCFPPEHVAVVTGGPEVAGQLLEQRFDFLFFTGSTEIGRLVARKAAEHLAPRVLELGGKCPCVVDATADLPMTARRLLAGKLFNAGQTCFAPDFVAVQDEVREPLTAELAALLEELPWEEELGRIINERHVSRLQKLATGNVLRKGTDDPAQRHVAPCLLPDAEWTDPVMREEVFGPILPVAGFRDVEDLIGKLRALPSPLALYCFSRNKQFIETLLDRVPSGSVCINDTMKQATNLQLPFGGVGESGMGRYRGRAGFEAFTYERAITKRFFLRDWFELLPPRAKGAKFLRRWMK